MSSATARKSVLRRFSSSISDLLSIQKRVEDEREKPLHNAILMGNLTTLKQLIHNGICDIDQEDEKGHTALHIAMEQHGTEAASILLANGASPEVIDFQGVTPAHLACAAGNIDSFDLLLYYKADVCAVDKMGRSPLDTAAEQGRLMMVEKILESGLPLDVLRKAADSHTASALHLAARMGHVQVVFALLQYGWDIERMTEKGSALHEAASHGRTQVVRLLLHMGIDPSSVNSRGLTACDCAKKSSSRNPISSKEIRSLLKNHSSFSYAEAIIDYNGESVDELTLTRGDLLWVIDKGNSEDVRYRGVIFGEKGNSRCGYFDSKAVRATERPSSVISVPNNRFSGMPMHHSTGTPRAPMKVEVPLPPNMKGHPSASQMYPHKEEVMIRQNSTPLPTLSQNSSNSSRSMSRLSDGRPMNDANGNRIRNVAPQYSSNNPNMRMSTFKSGMTTSMAPISLSSPVDHTQYGATVNSPRDSTGSNSSGFESLKSQGISGNTSSSPSHASFRSATTMLVDSPQSRISMNGSHSNESSAPSSHSSCSVDTLDDAILPLDVTAMVQKGINEGEILALWFERLGHTEYLSLFLTQGYDLASIARITPEDLITLGIKNPQHRMKLIAEIHSWHLTDSWPDSIPPGGLREWLNMMGLPEYADTFESQGYDAVEKISRLCWEDFEDIGVKRLGHLKRLQLALKKLKNRGSQPAQKTRSTSVFSAMSPLTATSPIYSRPDPPPPAPISILKKPSSAMSDIDYFSYARHGATSHYSDPMFAERRRQPLNLNLTATSKILSDRSIIEQPSNYTGSGVDCPPPPAPLSYESTRRLKDPSWDSTHSSTSTLHAQPLFADADDTGTIRARQKAKPLPPEHLISRLGLGSTFFQDPIPTNDDGDEDPLGDVSNMLENLMHDLEAHTKPGNRRSVESHGSFPV